MKTSDPVPSDVDPSTSGTPTFPKERRPPEGLGPLWEPGKLTRTERRRMLKDTHTPVSLSDSLWKRANATISNCHQKSLESTFMPQDASVDPSIDGLAAAVPCVSELVLVNR